MNFKIGEKIKKRRTELGLTQSQVADGHITRNMLSLIESGNAMPSIETAEYISAKLDIPLSYLFSTDENMFVIEKNIKIGYIRELFGKGNYEYCMKIIDELEKTDDELSFIYAFCAFEHGKALVMSGSLESAEKHLNSALDKARETLYSTSEIEATAPLYLSVASNIQSPLLELDTEIYEELHMKAFDYEFFKYITLDYDFPYRNSVFKKHLDAKLLIKRYNYFEALNILKELEDTKTNEYNAYVMFGVYSDIELSYKQIGDFENAYRYSSKRLSLINAFKS